MEGPVTQKLKESGLDVRFLAWLEGPGDRLPLLHNLAKIKPAQLAGAIRGAEWLAGKWSQAELLSPHSPQEWRDRYNRLSAFLVTALRFSGVFYRRVDSADVEALERTINAVVSPGRRGTYLEGVGHLRAKGLPMKLPAPLRVPRSGGKRQSEQVRRMRAAAEYVSSVSREFYDDLADFWNECQQEREYYRDDVRSKLLKGLPHGAKPPGGAQELEFWRCNYEGDLWSFFPGPLP